MREENQMRTIMKRMAIAILALGVLSACGENKSGGKNKSSHSGNIGIGTNGYTTQGENYSNLDQMRTAFGSKSLADGIANGANVYHVGTYFGGSNSGGGQVSVEVYGCLNLLFWQVGDCDSGMNDISSYLESALNMGRIWQVQSASGSSVAINEAYDVLNNDYLFQPRTFDRNDANYRDMLALDRSDIVDVRISGASVRLTNNQVIPATLVEYFYGNNYTGQMNITGMKRFILSNNLPVVANPVAVIDQNGYLTGYLSNVGTQINVQSITVERMHSVYYGNIQQSSGQQTVNLR